MESAVVEALSQQYDIRECVVNGQDDRFDVSFGFSQAQGKLITHHCRKNSLHDSTNDIGEISKQPYDHKFYAQTFSAATSEVFNDLRREHDDPAGYYCVSD